MPFMHHYVKPVPQILPLPHFHAGEPRWGLLTTLSGYHDRTIYSVDWSTTGMLATACADNGIRIFQEVQPEGASGVRGLFSKLGVLSSLTLTCRKDQAH